MKTSGTDMAAEGWVPAGEEDSGEPPPSVDGKKLAAATTGLAGCRLHPTAGPLPGVRQAKSSVPLPQ